MTPARGRRRRIADVLLTIAVNAVNAPPAQFFYGGQAVIEGVLMRGRRHFAVAARRPDGTITVTRERLTSKVYVSRFWRQPFIRGVAGLYETLNLGMRALSWSANVQLGDEVEFGAGAMRATVAGAVVFALLLFIVIPLLIGGAVHNGRSDVTRVIIEGAFRAVVLLGYLFLIGRVASVKRVFEYHGAEHKAINNLESGHAGDVAHVRTASRLHPRCGTGFVVVVALVSIIVFAPLGFLPVWERVGLQILLVPVVAAVAYEVIRALARVRHTTGGRIALVPVLAAQRLTTREPDDAQIEVAIAALEAARSGEEGAGEASSPLIP